MYLIILPAGLPLPFQAAWIKEFNCFCLMAFFPALAEQCFFVWALSTSGEKSRIPENLSFYLLKQFVKILLFTVIFYNCSIFALFPLSETNNFFCREIPLVINVLGFFVR